MMALFCCPPQWVEGFSKKTAVRTEYTAAQILARLCCLKGQRKLCVSTRSVWHHRWGWRKALKTEVLPSAWGAHPNLKRELCYGPFVRTFASTRRTTRITSLCLLIALCCFVFLCLPVFVRFQSGLEPNPRPISSLSTSASLKRNMLTKAC